MANELRSRVGEFGYTRDREQIHAKAEEISRYLNEWIAREGHAQLKEFSRICGITFEMGLDGLTESDHVGVPKFQIHSLRPARRVGPDGGTLNQLIISMVQTRRIKIVVQEETAEDAERPPDTKRKPPGKPLTTKFRGGCTLILDLNTMKLQYAVAKDISDENRLRRHQEYRELMMDGSLRAMYFGTLAVKDEPFAMLHRSFDHGRPD